MRLLFQGAHFVHPETEAWRDIKWAQKYFEKLKLCISLSMSPDYGVLSVFVYEMLNEDFKLIDFDPQGSPLAHQMPAEAASLSTAFFLSVLEVA